MSGDILRLIPTNPELVPRPAAVKAAERAFRAMVLATDPPSETDVGVEVRDEVHFHDQGGNFEKVSCPSCGKELAIDWWGDAMDRAWESRFRSLAVATPCCGLGTSLNDLVYDSPAGFARFALVAWNPGRAVSNSDVRTLEEILGCPLREVWAHY